MVIGVLPDMTTSEASPDLDVAIVTGLRDARNLINVLSSDVVIACPGALGTMSEIALALKHDKPVILLNVEVGPHLAPYEARGQLTQADTPEAAVDRAGVLLSRNEAG
jgi:uncharacterized protein (TIGR00725 family)